MYIKFHDKIIDNDKHFKNMILLMYSTRVMYMIINNIVQFNDVNKLLYKHKTWRQNVNVIIVGTLERHMPYPSHVISTCIRADQSNELV